ncbi:uncharacterized protein LOC119688544 [Teleopsis dalmanni]|uniref:uncharacterized protein LOC119688544 n=1 Tax=Teleopsis dalmanni TaxID=139649 RepID=UPI0018CDC4F7|nr:uncharacterized protein LOC119688544 [Teleopsis dalmanni]
MKIIIGVHEILSQEAIKYLGVMIDARLSFKQHLRAGERRRLLSTVTDSIIFYATIWAAAKKHQIRLVAQIHRRSALRFACAYRTVSDDAICVIAGKLPVDIHAKELSRLYDRQGIAPTIDQKSAELVYSFREWQQRWQQSSKGRWTYTIIPNSKESPCSIVHEMCSSSFKWKAVKTFAIQIMRRLRLQEEERRTAAVIHVQR